MNLQETAIFLMGEGKVDEGIALEEILREVETIRKAKAICPSCGALLHRVRYEGYYDEFNYWECSNNCEAEPVRTWKGRYA